MLRKLKNVSCCSFRIDMCDNGFGNNRFYLCVYSKENHDTFSSKNGKRIYII